MVVVECGRTSNRGSSTCACHSADGAIRLSWLYRHQALPVRHCAGMITTKRRQKLKNQKLEQKPRFGTLQYVYTVSGEELCAVEADARPAEVRATVMRMLSLTGPVGEAVELIPSGDSAPRQGVCVCKVWNVAFDFSALPIFADVRYGRFSEDSNHCDACYGRFAEEAGILLEDYEACTLCHPTDCPNCRPLKDSIFGITLTISFRHLFLSPSLDLCKYIDIH